MDAFEAADLGRKVIAKMFAEEGPFDIGLEEVSQTPDGYVVLVSFSRKWDQLSGAVAAMIKPARITKEIRLSPDGNLLSIKGKAPFQP